MARIDIAEACNLMTAMVDNYGDKDDEEAIAVIRAYIRESQAASTNSQSDAICSSWKPRSKTCRIDGEPCVGTPAYICNDDKG